LAPDKQFTYDQLREAEKQLTIEFKPTLDLDLDIRTRRFNPLANKLDSRSICRIQAGKNSLTSI
jgi:hypothetical protein